MRIPHDIRRESVEAGMLAKATEFRDGGGEIYVQEAPAV
jgi:hypothetical protein